MNEEMKNKAVSADDENTDKTEVTEDSAKENETAQITEVTENTEEKKPEKKSNWINDICEMAETVLLCMLVFLFFREYVIDQARVDGPSMQPNFYTDDRVLYNHLYTPKRGDIVIVDASDKLGEALIKRVIAVEGDLLDIREDGYVYVNGEQVNEQIKANPDDKLTKDYFISSLTTSKDYPSHEYPVTIPEGYVFVMGDNRINSMDSRSAFVDWIPEENIVGKVFCRFSRTEENVELYGDKFAWFW